MSRIAGYAGQVFAQDNLYQMLRTMDHHANTVYGHFADDLTGLSHFTISSKAQSHGQPITDDSGRYVIVMCGEIYNFRALNAQFQLPVKTGTAAECLLELFVKDGISSLSHIRGVYAAAIWDKLGRKLWVFRDRAGVMPMYYAFDEGQLVFASEFRAIRSLVVEPQIDKRAVHNFLLLGFLPSGQTLVQGIHKLPPGHCLEYFQGKIQVKPYWKPDIFAEADPHDMNMDIAVVKLEKILQQVMARYVDRKSPVQVYLSGSVESAMLVAAMQKYLRRPVHTVSAGTGTKEEFMRSDAGKAVSGMDIRHVHLQLSTAQSGEWQQAMCKVYDEPLADPRAMHSVAVASALRERGGTILTAEGGNELFHGYGRYFWPERIRAWSGYWKVMYPLLSWLPWDALHRVNRLMQYPARDNLLVHTFSAEQGFFSAEELRNWGFEQGQDEVLPVISVDLMMKRRSANDLQAFWDFKYYLPDDLLYRLDRTAHYYDLNIRYPLLDHTLVEFVLNLSEKLKHHKRKQKLLLQQMQLHYNPALKTRHWAEPPRLIPFGVLEEFMHKNSTGELISAVQPHVPGNMLPALEKMVRETSRGSLLHRQRLYTLYCLNEYLKSL